MRRLGAAALMMALTGCGVPTSDVIETGAPANDTNAILTLDRRDFRAVRPLGRHKVFRVLPDDLPL